MLASSSEMERVRRFTDFSFFEKVGPQVLTPTSMADLTAMYKAKHDEHSTWFTWLFPCLSALATILCVYIMYITLTPFHTFFRQPSYYCVRRKLPVKDSVELAVPQILTPGQGQLQVTASLATGTGSDEPRTVAVEPALRYVKY
jgi:hypothetical protein